MRDPLLKIWKQLNILHKEPNILCEEKTWYAKWIQIKSNFIQINTEIKINKEIMNICIGVFFSGHCYNMVR